MQVKSIAECSKGSILQYFRPSLSYHLSSRYLFCLFFKWPFYTGFTVYSLHYFFKPIQQSLTYRCLWIEKIMEQFSTRIIPYENFTLRLSLLYCIDTVVFHPYLSQPLPLQGDILQLKQNILTWSHPLTFESLPWSYRSWPSIVPTLPFTAPATPRWYIAAKTEHIDLISSSDIWITSMEL